LIAETRTIPRLLAEGGGQGKAVKGGEPCRAR
jgi:hypothetical protein